MSAEFGVIMLLSLRQAWDARFAAGITRKADLLDAIREGAVLRVRPKVMTVAVILGNRPCWPSVQPCSASSSRG